MISDQEVLPIIPLDAYLFFPTEEEIKIGKDKKAYRRIYEGQIQFEEFEKKMIFDFKAYLLKNKHYLDEWWIDSKILRFLYANNWKFDKSIKSMILYTEWQKEKIPPKFTEATKEFLESGILYIHGRDNRFRPIIVFQAFKIKITDVDIENILDSVTYLLYYVVDKLMLPGQIENWVFIIDLNKTGLSDLPITLLKKIISYMSNNFRSRLYVMYVVQAPNTINFMWSMIKGFLEETTQRKIQIIKQIIPENLFKHTNREQIEKKFGGVSKDVLQKYWPPIIPSENYFLEYDKKDIILISKDDYLKKINQGLLKCNKICSFFQKSKPALENFLNGNSKKEKEIINNNKDIVIIEKNWDLSNGGEKKKIDKTQMDIWNFEFLTIEDENPKITSSKYLDNLVVFKTKKNLDKIRQKQKKK